MTILALDTSGKTASAALMNGYIIMAESSAQCKTHSETLMPMVDRLFKLTGTSAESIDYIACTCGPGSFTGLRIGAATAKGLAFALGKKLIAVPTLDAMAYTVDSLHIPGAWVVPMIDARRGQAYSAFYYEGKRVTDYMAESVEDLQEMVKARAQVGSNIIYTTGPVRASSVGSVALSIALSTPDAAADESGFSLLYIRKPQAEREKEEKMKRKS